MLNRIIEYFLISRYNQRRDARLARAKPVSPPPVEVPPDYTILGHLLPWPDGEASDPVVMQLHDRGIVALPPEARQKHVYILGATGTGKTNLVMRLIDSDIKSRRAFCVVDLRGDLVDRVLLRLADTAPASAWKQRLLLIDLRDKENVVGFNPLASEDGSRRAEESSRRSEDGYSRALHVLSMIKQQSSSWGVQLEETLRHALIALAQSGWTLLEVQPLLTNSGFRSLVLPQVQDRWVREFLERLSDSPAAQQAAQVPAVLNKLTPLLGVPALRNLFGQKQTFCFRELIDQQPGMVILVALGVDRLHDAAKLAGGLLLSSLETAIMSRSDQPEAERVPVHLYVDEFENLVSDSFHKIISEGRRLKFGLTLSHQNTYQVPPDMRNALRSNIHTHAYFQTGAQDAAEAVKEIGGKNREQVRQCIMSQQTGQAFLVRRGQSSVRMQVQHSPDPKVTAEKVAAVRAASLQTFGRPTPDVEAEIEARFDQWRASPPSRNGAASGAGQPARQTAGRQSAVYEIKDSKPDHFAPRRRTASAAERDDAASDRSVPEGPVHIDLDAEESAIEGAAAPGTAAQRQRPAKTVKPVKPAKTVKEAGEKKPGPKISKTRITRSRITTSKRTDSGVPNGKVSRGNSLNNEKSDTTPPKKERTGHQGENESDAE